MLFSFAIILLPFFWLGIVAAFVYGFTLLYHWIRYAHMYPVVWIVLPIYVVGTIILIGALIASMASI